MRTSLLITVAALALTGCAGPTEVARDSGNTGRSVPVTAEGNAFDVRYGHALATHDESSEEFAGVGVATTSAPSTASPAVSQREALAAVRADGMGNGLPDPTMTLKSFTKSEPMLATGKRMTGALVWDVVFVDAPLAVHTPSHYSGPSIEPVPCDLHVIVDAESAEVLEGFQAGCVVGH